MNDKYGKVKIPQGMYAIYYFLIVEMISNYIKKLDLMLYYVIYILYSISLCTWYYLISKQMK